LTSLFDHFHLLFLKYYAFAPNKPFGIRSSFAHFIEKGKGRDWIFGHTNPLLDIAELTTQLMHLLTIPSNYAIDNLTNDFKGIGKKSYELFQEDLKVIGDDINQRNKKSKSEGRAVYHYLHPSKIPASIDI
jgi:hypothetical protein